MYTDEDGIKHYLEYDTTESVYKDESGLNITMTIDSGSTDERYVLKDTQDNKLSFTSTGYLKYIYDNNGNYIQLNYTGDILTEVVDGAGRKTTLETNVGGHLLGIVDPSGRRTIFTYTGLNLTKITYPDGEYSTYEYDGNNNLTKATNYDGYRIAYEYYTISPYRVKKIEESNTDSTLGQELNVNYGYNTTTFTDYTGKRNIYQFNDLGNTISVRDDAGNAQYYKYNDLRAKKNKLSLQSKLQRSVLNYLKNHNVEEASNWTKAPWTVEPWARSYGSGSYRCYILKKVKHIHYLLM